MESDFNVTEQRSGSNKSAERRAELRMPPPPLLTLNEVARYLSVTRRCVGDYVRYRGLPVIRISPGMVRVDRRRLEEWLSKHTEDVTAAHRCRKPAVAVSMKRGMKEVPCKP